jgi:hypothetical protein
MTIFIFNSKSNSKFVSEYLDKWKHLMIPIGMVGSRNNFNSFDKIHLVEPTKDVPYKSDDEYQQFAIDRIRKVSHIIGA